MKFPYTAIAAYRYFSSQTTTKSTKWTRNRYKNKTSNPQNPGRTKIKLTDQQSQVLDAVSSGKSVFITGSAGTGKTVLLQHIIRKLNKLHRPSQVFVTASTGVAACALKGQTLHSFSGIGLAKADRQTLLNRVRSDKSAHRRWKKVRALVIDECSMVNAEFFDVLQYIAQKLRGEDPDCENKVWGGIQLVVSGDFFQLPPIIRKKKLKGEREFAFEADCWNSSFDLQVELTKVFRQSGVQLVKLLQNIRRGEMDPENLQLIQKCCSETEPDSTIVQLFPRSEDVDEVNKKKINQLDMPVYVYRALDVGEHPWKRQLKRGLAPDELMLCEGARVMLTKNLRPWRKLVNGTPGTVIGFTVDNKVDVSDICKKKSLPVVKFDSGPTLIVYPEKWVVTEGDKIVASRKQIPLILAWALSIHKCQGMTLDSLHTNLTRAFGVGMVYVALSRVRSLDGLHLSGFESSKVKAHPKVIEFYQRFSSNQDKQGEEDKSSITNAIHVSNKTNRKEVNINPSLNFQCKPNSSLISWYNSVTKRGWE